MEFRRYIAVALTVLVFLSVQAEAQILEKLVMPGPVSDAHAKTEANCDACHAPFSKEKQRSLCLDCHEDVGKDLVAGVGFHGRNASIRAAECATCHTEHEGRDFDIVGLNNETFDHANTDFALEGAHAVLSCSACHSIGQKFREAPGECIACHESDDAHKGSMGRDCASCHSASTWFDTVFDHGKTDFALEGAHKKIQCNACHPDSRYDKTPKACVACHALNDPHRGVYGQKCAQCHTPQDWKQAKFDHATTAFALRGRHAVVECATCHTYAQRSAKLPKRCIDCHLADDVHKGAYGLECQTCHAEQKWKTARFDHDKATDFPLLGAHKSAKCVACHTRGGDASQVASSCVSCHSGDDPHAGRLGTQCADCHVETAWLTDIRFDHDLTDFPLLGLHVAAPCEACHTTRTFKDTEAECISCHRDDDDHNGALGSECADCHNPSGWTYWQFNHAEDTDYALTGAHSDLVCKACHISGNPSKTSTTCGDCHADDDVHRGQFGSRCDYCHATDDFKNVRMTR